jgi:L-fucose isomerase-like protein
MINLETVDMLLIESEIDSIYYDLEAIEEEVYDMSMESSYGSKYNYEDSIKSMLEYKYKLESEYEELMLKYKNVFGTNYIK